MFHDSSILKKKEKKNGEKSYLFPSFVQHACFSLLIIITIKNMHHIFVTV